MSTSAGNDARKHRQWITVIGGTGFVGRRAVRHLVQRGRNVRVAVRRPERVAKLFGNVQSPVEAVPIDMFDDRSIGDAVADSDGVINAVSLYVERGGQTYWSVHVDAAERVARVAHARGIACLVHMSGIGADPASASSYIRARGEGDAAVVRAFPGATVLRSAVMFGPDDAFLNTIIRLLRLLPVYPMFGRGETRLQPVHVDNVGEAIAVMLHDPAMAGRAVEIGGPEVFTYAGLLRAVAAEIDVRPRLLPLPYGIWFGLARTLDVLPNPPVTRSQIELMLVDTVASGSPPVLQALGISPHDVRSAVRAIRDTAK